MFKTSSTTGLIPSIEKLDSIARQTGLITRHSHRFSGHGFLLSLMQNVLRGNNSLNHIAGSLGRFQPKKMSRQAMQRRIGESSTSFLTGVLMDIVKRRTRNVLGRQSPIRRVLIEDSSVLTMHHSNHTDFAGNGNGRNTAGAKVHLLADWLSGDVLECAMHAARCPDQKLARVVLPHCREGDLVIRDMGFFHMDSLRKIENSGAFWLSRLPAAVSAYDSRGRNLDDLLEKDKRKQFCIDLYLGKERRKMKCRLVATRLDKTQTEKNRRLRRRNAKRHGATPSKRGLLRDGWSLLVTNVPEELIEPAKLYELYSLRWSIEIQFRGFKQSCRIDKALNHRSSRHHLQALVLAAMIYQVITLKTQARIRRRKDGSGVSYEKLCDDLSGHFLTLTRDTIQRYYDPDIRHLNHDTRTRQTLYSTGLHSLS